jgi:4-aminobutyrate aminotransferase
MQYLWDGAGKKYLDFFAGVSVMNCGHSNPFILDRVKAQLDELQHLTNVYLTEPVLQLALRLAEVLPGNLKRSFFCMSGSEANEGALLLARIATGRRKFIARRGGLHGRTRLSMAVTGIPMWRADPFFPPPPASPAGPVEDVYFADTPQEIAAILAGDQDVAAFICEPIQGNGGIIPSPPGYFAEVLPLLRKHGVLLIADEVQSGFARTGRMFASEHYGLVPDIMTLSKALGNGIPIAAFCTTDAIAETFTRPSASTLGGNPVSCAAALGALDYLRDQNLCARSQALGDRLLDGLRRLKNRFPVIREVRGLGLMAGAELADPDTGAPLPGRTDFVLEELLKRGVILGKNGLARNVLAFQPPLVITDEDLDFLLGALEEVFNLDFSEAR